VADTCSLHCLFIVLLEFANDVAPAWMRYSVMSALGSVVLVSLGISIKKEHNKRDAKKTTIKQRSLSIRTLIG
jgi:hypothetical protein